MQAQTRGSRVDGGAHMQAHAWVVVIRRKIRSAPGRGWAETWGMMPEVTGAVAGVRSPFVTRGRMTDDERWDVVVRRDALLRGAFVLGVTSTGIYCRPGCPARRPLRRNVCFFDTAGQAEQAGFRPCLRCRPQADIPAGDARIARVCRFIAAHLDERLTLARLAKVAGLSAFHLQRRFTGMLGLSPRAYADALRLKTFRRELRGGRGVLDAAVEAGYGSTSRVYDRAVDHLGMTPSGYRGGAVAQQIRYAIGETALGPVLIASTDLGVCAVRMDDSRSRLAQALRDEFPEATLQDDPDALASPMAIVRALAAGRRAATGVPLDIVATAFQHQVWTALRHIPRGETRSYRDIARAIGRPTAIRAVANACANNPVALLIPCHRVTRANGTPGGYRWGSAKKRQLLATEQSTPESPY